jgi:valyl-tRNA synthetase
MRGKEVFYPMGWDDNGLPTERRVQNYYGVRCDPSLPYDPNFQPPPQPGKQPVSVSRPNFIELCARLTVEDEKAFEHLWKFLGLSVDWSMTYATIGSDRSVSAGLPAAVAAPPDHTNWKRRRCGTSISDGRRAGGTRDREMPGATHRVAFSKADGSLLLSRRRVGTDSCMRRAGRAS